MDILFVNVPLVKTCVGGVCPSLSFLVLATHLRREGLEVEIHDPAALWDLKAMEPQEVLGRLVDEIVARAPRILGLSCKIPSDGQFSVRLAGLVKERLPDTMVVLGGLWPTPCWEAILRRFPEIDAVVQGEGEIPLTEMARRLRSGASPFAGVPNLAYRQGTMPHANPRAPLIDPASVAPLDLSLLAHPERYTIFAYLTSRGCPYECAFCSEQIVYNRYMEEPLGRIADDLQALVRLLQAETYLWISDPIFGTSSERLRALCHLLRATPFSFLLESRVDILRPADLPDLREAGCDLIYFGLESASYASLVRLNKVRHRRHFEVYRERALGVVEACMRNDITPVLGVLNPLPLDGQGEMAQTLGFLEELAALGARVDGETGLEAGLHLYAFPYRLVRGTVMANQRADFEAGGATWDGDPEDVLQDVRLRDASFDVSAGEAEEFRIRVRKLVSPGRKAMMRVMRTIPPPPMRGF